MPTSGQDWVFPAHCTHVVDGDTLDLVVDVGFRMTREVRVRLSEVDTAEVYGVNASELGQEQAQFVREWLAQAEGMDEVGKWPLVVRTEQTTGKYGRYIATIERGDGEYLHEALVDEWPDLAQE